MNNINTEALRDARAAIDLVLHASFIDWTEEIAPSKRGQEDADESRKESKAMVWALLEGALERIDAALGDAS
jgi:hypothetical protein